MKKTCLFISLLTLVACTERDLKAVPAFTSREPVIEAPGDPLDEIQDPTGLTFIEKHTFISEGARGYEYDNPITLLIPPTIQVDNLFGIPLGDYTYIQFDATSCFYFLQDNFNHEHKKYTLGYCYHNEAVNTPIETKRIGIWSLFIYNAQGGLNQSYNFSFITKLYKKNFNDPDPVITSTVEDFITDW